MKITNDYVFFWGSKLSNFYPCPIEYLEQQFHCSEQIFMYCKAIHFKDEDSAILIAQASTPQEAKALGRRVSNFNSDEWDRVKYYYMMEAITAKFTQNWLLKKWLLDPRFDNKTFVEASPVDSIWGIGMAENNLDLLDTSRWGQNLLGKALTELRDKLKQEPNDFKY